MKLFCYFVLALFSFSSFSLFNLKTGEEQEPDINSKKWVIVAQNCHSCFELLADLKIFCKNRKPSPEKMGFLVSGSSQKAMLKKLKDFKQEYEIFAGSPNELYQHYNVVSSPSLKIDGGLISGKNAVLKHLKEDQDFCSA